MFFSSEGQQTVLVKSSSFIVICTTATVEQSLEINLFLLVTCYFLANKLASCVSAATSSSQQRQSSPLPQSDSFFNMSAANSISAALPFIPSSTSTSSLLPRGPGMAPHQHTVTSSSSSYPQVSLSQQTICLTDTDILQ